MPEAGMDIRGEQENVQGVGALLRASRLRCGEDVHDVSRVLCIRHSYLEAIESGRFHELPGPTYAVGFVRAYAAHLGLDSAEVVRRFKAESAKIGGRAELSFPTPVVEAGIPGGALVFVGVLVAVLAYGAWYLNTTKEGYLAELIAPVPERLAALLSSKDEGKLAEVANATPAPVSTASATAATLPDTAPAKADDVAPAPTVETAATAPESSSAPSPAAAGGQGEESSGTGARPPESSDPSTESTPSAAASAEPAGESAAAPVGESRGASDPQPSAVPAATANEPAAPAMHAASEFAGLATSAASRATDIGDAPRDASAAAAPEVAAAAPRAAEAPTAAKPAASATAPTGERTATTDFDAPAAPPRTGPAAASGTQVASLPAATGATAPAAERPRIIVRAKMNSWIQVRDDINNQLLVTRLLKPGDDYAVPDRPGLKLLTGNAGAIEILVDGEIAPSIGSVGTVRRNVALDVERLRAGTAVAE